jgi:hypothetical protein
MTGDRIMTGTSLETLKLEVKELTEMLRADDTFADLRAALTAHHMQLEDYLLGGLIDGEDGSSYGVLVGRDGVCTVFEEVKGGEFVRWERVEDPESLASAFGAVNVAISLATADR